MVATARHTGAVTEVEVYEEARGRWAEFLNGKDVWSPLAHNGLLVEGMKNAVERAVAEPDAFEAGLEWTSEFGATWIEARLEDQFRDSSSADDAVDIGRLVENTRLLGAAGALALGANRASADPTAWMRAVEVVRGLGIDVTDGVKASAFGSWALALIEAAAPAASELSEVATVGSWAAWLVKRGGEGRGLRVPVVSLGGVTPVKFMALRRRKSGGLLEHPRSALLPLGAKYVGAIRDAWESAGKPAVTWQLNGFKAGSGNQLGASHGGQVAVGMRLVTRGADVYDSSHVVMALVEKTAEGGWILKPLDGVVEVEKVGGLLGERPNGSIGVLAKRECHDAIRKSAKERGRAGAVRTHWTSDLDEAVKWASGDVDAMFEYLRAVRTELSVRPRYIPQSVDLASLGQTARVTVRKGSASVGAAPDQGRHKSGRSWTDVWHGGVGRIVLLGGPGYGKSWLLRNEALRIAEEAEEALQTGEVSVHDLVLPFYARVRDLRMDKGYKSLHKAILKRVEKFVPEDARLQVRAQVTSKLDSGRVILFLDAFDEALAGEKGEGSKVGPRQGLEELARGAPSARIVLSSRNTGYAGAPFPDAEQVDLAGFDQPEIVGFVESWFGKNDPRATSFVAKLDAAHQTRQLARIPLFLSFLCRMFEPGDAVLPARRVDLFEGCLRGLLCDWPRERGGGEGLTRARYSATLEVLQDVLCELLEAGDVEFGDEAFRWAIQEWQSNRPSSPPHELAAVPAGQIIDDLIDSGLIVRTHPEPGADLSVVHYTLHEYTAARSLAARGIVRLIEWVDEHSQKPEWDEVAVLAAGCVPTPVPLLEALVDPERDSRFRHRLALAAQCLPELARTPAAAVLVETMTSEVLDLWLAISRRDIEAVAPHLKRALRSLALSGRIAGVPLLHHLADQLAHSEEERVLETISVLADIGPFAATDTVLDAVVRLVRSIPWEWPDSSGTFNQCMKLLGDMGPLAAVPDVLDLFRDALKEPEVAWLAQEYVTKLGRSAGRDDIIDILLNYYRGSGVSWSVGILRALGADRMPRVAASFQRALLARDLDHPQLHLELLEIRTWRHEVVAAEDIRAALIDIVNYRPMWLFWEDALESLESMCLLSTEPSVVTTLTEMLDGPSGRERLYAIRALIQLGDAIDIRRAKRALCEELSGPNRHMALYRVRELGAKAACPEVIEALLLCIKGHVDGRKDAVNAIGELGHEAGTETVTSALVEILREDLLGDVGGGSALAEAAARALGRIALTLEPSQSATVREWHWRSGYWLSEILHLYPKDRLADFIGEVRRGVYMSRASRGVFEGIRYIGDTPAFRTNVLCALVELLRVNNSYAAWLLGSMEHVVRTLEPE